MAIARNKWNLGEKKKQEGPRKERAVLIGIDDGRGPNEGEFVWGPEGGDVFEIERTP